MMVWRIGLIVALCLVLAECEEDEILTCEGGECVKLNECPNGELDGNGTDVIDIRFNAENECEHYLLKCCPYPKDEYDGDNVMDNEAFAVEAAQLVTTPSIATVSERMSAEAPKIVPSLVENVENGSQKPLGETSSAFQRCGWRNAGGVDFRITGNSDGVSDYGEFPWMAAIFKEQQALERTIIVYVCGGSLIHPSVVLTTAHYVRKEIARDMKDRIVVEVVSHADFSSGSLANDVALLFLDNPVELMKTVNTICLPPANHNFDLSRCFASGWGKDVFGKNGLYSVILKKIELPIVPRGQCQRALRTTRLGRRFKLHKSLNCAGGEKGRDTCKGDGGSPLVCPIPGTLNRYYQAGMVAWGIGCGEDGIPGVYVNVPMFRGWIDDHLRQRNISSNYYQYA